MSPNMLIVLVNLILLLFVGLSHNSVAGIDDKIENVAKPRPIVDAAANGIKTLEKEPSKTINATNIDIKHGGKSRGNSAVTDVTDATDIVDDIHANVSSAKHGDGGGNDSYQAASIDHSSHDHTTTIRKIPEHVFSLDNGAVKRTFFVIAALSGIVILYFVIKGVTIRRKPKIQRYGLLAERELESLDDGDDEDEDMTLFDASRHKMKTRGP